MLLKPALCRFFQLFAGKTTNLNNNPAVDSGIHKNR